MKPGRRERKLQYTKYLGQTFLLDNNLSPILLRLSNNLPYAPRSYAGFSDSRSKKVKKVCDINLTYAGYGALCVEDSLPG